MFFSSISSFFFRRSKVCLLFSMMILTITFCPREVDAAIGNHGRGTGGRSPRRSSPRKASTSSSQGGGQQNQQNQQVQQPPQLEQPPPRKRTWMNHFVVHKGWNCTQIPSNPVIIGGDGGGAGKSLEKFLFEANAVQFGPVDEDGNSVAQKKVEWIRWF